MDRHSDPLKIGVRRLPHILLLVWLTMLLLSCETRKFDSSTYVSFHPGNEYSYSGAMLTTTVESSRESKVGVELSVVDRDSAGGIVSRETYLIAAGKLWWSEFDGTPQGMLRHRFEPPLLASPFSDNIGQEFSQEGLEIRSDTPQTRLRYRMDSQIEAIADVTVPAGYFPRCIQMKSRFTYLEPTASPFIVGEGRWWYAKGIGVVKYEITGVGGELLRARIREVILPR